LIRSFPKLRKAEDGPAMQFLGSALTSYNR
jgi:hypothetical protein